MTVDSSGFNRACELCIEHTDRTMPEFANGQGLAVASRAIKHTFKAAADRIAIELGQIATQRSVSKKTGKVRLKRIYRTDSLAAILVNALHKKKGEPLVWGDALEAEAAQLRAKRLRAVGFIRSGWIAAIKTLSAAVGYRNEGAGDANRTQPRGPGYAVPAKRVLSGEVSCEIGNMALVSMSEFGHSSNPMTIAVTGLQAALDETEKDMLQHLAEKLQPVLNRVSA